MVSNTQVRAVPAHANEPLRAAPRGRARARMGICSGECAACAPRLLLADAVRRSAHARLYVPEQFACLGQVGERLPNLIGALRLKHCIPCAGFDGLREACESLPPDMRLPLFAHCVDIVLADGRLLPIEVEFLDRIMSFLGVDPAEGKRVMEVLLIKNRF